MHVRVHAHLYACACVFPTQAAGQGPATGGDVGHLGDGLHPLWAAYTHLEEGTTHEKLLSATLGYIHCLIRYVVWYKLLS